MLSRIIVVLKPVIIIFVIILALKVTGFTGVAAETVQTAALKTGLRDANVENEELKGEDFDYNFSLKDLKGNKIRASDFKGKVIFLNMWATWCPPCRAEMPTIQKLYEGVDHNNIVFIMLSLDKDGDQQKIVNFVNAKSFTFPVFQPSGYLTNQLNIPVIPTTFVISRDGKIVSKEEGYTNFNTAKFKKFLEKL